MKINWRFSYWLPLECFLWLSGEGGGCCWCVHKGGCPQALWMVWMIHFSNWIQHPDTEQYFGMLVLLICVHASDRFHKFSFLIFLSAEVIYVYRSWNFISQIFELLNGHFSSSLSVLCTFFFKSMELFEFPYIQHQSI